MSKKKILMYSVTSILFDARIQKEAKTLRDAGYDVTILSIEDQAADASMPDLNKKWEEYQKEMVGIKTRAIYLKTRAWKKYTLFFDKPLQAIELLFQFMGSTLGRKYHFYHCHDLMPGIFALTGHWINRGKLIYDAHELELEQLGEVKSNFFKRVMALYERTVVKHADAVITVNRSIANTMQDMYGKEVFVIENKPEPSNIYSDKYNLKRHGQIPEDKSVVIYTGLLSKERGLDKMVNAMRFLPDHVIFAILGVGRLDEFKLWLKELCDELSVDPSRIYFLDAVTPTVVPSMMHGADVSIMLYQSGEIANNQVNAPNKLFQSIMAQVPVLASDNQSFPKYVYENGYGPVGETVDESDGKAIADRILYMLDVERNATYRNNAKLYSKEVSWDQEAERLIHIYTALQK